MDNTLNIVHEETSPCHIKLSVEVPVEQVQSVFKSVESQFRKHARIPGFRPGKAPRTLLRGQYGDKIRDDAVSQLVRDNVQAALKQEGLAPETTPHIDNEDNLKANENEPFVFAFEFDVAPKFDLPDYKSIELDESAEDIDDTAVDTVINQILSSRTSYEKVERAAEKGDMIKADYSATNQDELDAAETAKFLLNGDDAWVGLKEPEILPDIAEIMAGVEAGDIREFNIDFPEDFYEKSLAGKSVEYKMEVKEVHAAQMPELTDDLAKELGAESADDVKTKIRDNLEQREKQQQGMRLREQVVAALADQLEFELPPNMLARRRYDTMSQIFQERLRQQGENADLNSQLDEMRQEADKVAKDSLKRSYILRRIADEENIQVGMEEINQTIQQMSMYHRQPPKKLLRQLQENGRIMELIENMREHKTVEHVLELIRKKSENEKEEQEG